VFTPPYVVAYIQVRGADTRLMHLIQEIEPSRVHIGMAVEPVWSADDELDTSMNAIRYYRPIPSSQTRTEAGVSDA
jgi:uncharacterized protein